MLIKLSENVLQKDKLISSLDYQKCIELLFRFDSIYTERLIQLARKL